MNLTPHFTLEELTFSSTALRLGIQNVPTDGDVDNLRMLASGLEEVRALLGHPLHIDSGYRSPALNSSVGGARTSQHMTGQAADFVCPQFGTPQEIVVEIAASSIQFDQCICEGTWVHISFTADPRRKVLTAHFDKYGRATYTEGVTA